MDVKHDEKVLNTEPKEILSGVNVAIIVFVWYIILSIFVISAIAVHISGIDVVSKTEEERFNGTCMWGIANSVIGIVIGGVAIVLYMIKGKYLQKFLHTRINVDKDASLYMDPDKYNTTIRNEYDPYKYAQRNQNNFKGGDSGLVV